MELTTDNVSCNWEKKIVPLQFLNLTTVYM